MFFVIILLLSFHAYSEVEAARVIMDLVDDVRHLDIIIFIFLLSLLLSIHHLDIKV